MTTTDYDFDNDFMDDNVTADDLQNLINPVANTNEGNNNRNNDNDNQDDDKSDPNKLEEDVDELRKYIFQNEEDQDDNQDDDSDQSQNDDQDGDQDDDSKNAQSNDQNNASNDDSDELDLLSILREENLLYIPEDFSGEFTEETLERLKEYTFERRDQEIIQSRREEIEQSGDPYKVMLFDYFMSAGVDADLPQFIDKQEYLKTFQNYNIDSEQDQRTLLKQYLLEGLDPKIPSNKMRIEKVDQDVEEILTNYEGAEKAKEAQEYFIQKGQSLLQEEFETAERAKQERENEELNKQQSQQRWHQEFQNKIKENSTYDVNRKKALIEEQYAVVRLNESEVPIWYAKELMIKSNPELYVRYLDWLQSSFDLNTGKFKDASTTSNPKNQVTKQILSLINKKGTGKSKGSETQIKQQTNNKNTIVNPLDYI